MQRQTSRPTVAACPSFYENSIGNNRLTLTTYLSLLSPFTALVFWRPTTVLKNNIIAAAEAWQRNTAYSGISL